MLVNSAAIDKMRHNEVYICGVIPFTPPRSLGAGQANPQAEANPPAARATDPPPPQQRDPLPQRPSTRRVAAASVLMNPESIRDLRPRSDGTRSVQTHNRKEDEKDGSPGIIASHVVYFV